MKIAGFVHVTPDAIFVPISTSNAETITFWSKGFCEAAARTSFREDRLLSVFTDFITPPQAVNG